MRHQQSAISKKHEHIGVGAHSMHILYYSLVATYLYECVFFCVPSVLGKKEVQIIRWGLGVRGSHY